LYHPTAAAEATKRLMAYTTASSDSSDEIDRLRLQQHHPTAATRSIIPSSSTEAAAIDRSIDSREINRQQQQQQQQRQQRD
jgi:hypothetical protein